MADTTTVQHKLSLMDCLIDSSPVNLSYINLGNSWKLSLAWKDDLKLLLSSLSTRLTDRHLVTSIIQCPPDPGSNITTPLYSVTKPFVWHRNESAGSGSNELSGNELRGEVKGDQVRAKL